MGSKGRLEHGWSILRAYRGPRIYDWKAEKTLIIFHGDKCYLAIKSELSMSYKCIEKNSEITVFLPYYATLLAAFADENFILIRKIIGEVITLL